jgi:hypothetical protein
MSNPIGFAPRVGPLEGLGYSTFVGGASPPNVVGSGADAQVAGTYGYWYLRPLGDLFLTDGGPRCSPTPMNASHADGTLVPYGAIPRNGNVTVTNVSTLAADAAAAASCEFVSVQAAWTPGLSSGHPYCQEDVDDPFVLTAFDITMGGGAVDLLPTVFSALAPPRASFTPLVIQPQISNSAHLLRPTALTWPGQDPDNQWNRAIWHRSEIGAIAWTMHAYAFSWTVDAQYIVTGFNRETSYPTPCPIIGGVLMLSTIAAGPGVAGLLAPPPPVGATAPAARTPTPAAGAFTTGIVPKEP